jgi:hypothetical protein
MGKLARRRLIGQATVATAAFMVHARRAGAQSAPFPAKPIRILVGFAAAAAMTSQPASSPSNSPEALSARCWSTTAPEPAV